MALGIIEGKLFPEGNLGEIACQPGHCPCARLRKFYAYASNSGLGQWEIARACSISQSTVHDYLKTATAAGVSWPLADGCDANLFLLASRLQMPERARRW